MQYTKEYRTCTKHLEFFKAYFEVAGIILRENVHMGVIYIQGEQLWGEKLPRLATIYLLVLKLIYDEQMQTASSSSHVVIYPCIHTVLLGDDIRELLATFSEEDQIGDEAAIQSTLEDMPE